MGGRVLNSARSGGLRVLGPALALLMAGAGCHAPGGPRDRIIPRAWPGNFWGPEADAARRTGRIPPLPMTPSMRVWDDWGRRFLRDGDVVFRMGDARAAFGLFSFSKFSAAIASSRFSHVGIVAREGDEVVVYDMNPGGPRRQPWASWVLDVTGDLAVRRPRPEHRHAIPGALAYCREVHRREVPFDRAFLPGKDQLYCAELVEEAYRSAGLPLAEPVRIDALPRFREFPLTVGLVRLCSSLEPDQRAIIVGNDRQGLWSSPALRTVYEATDALRPLGPILDRGMGSPQGP